MEADFFHVTNQIFRYLSILIERGFSGTFLIFDEFLLFFQKGFWKEGFFITGGERMGVG